MAQSEADRRFHLFCCPRRSRSNSDEPCRDREIKPVENDEKPKEKDSVFQSALQSESLDEIELASLSAFENAFLNSSANSRSIYFDAADDVSSPLYPYHPAAVALTESRLGSDEAHKADSAGDGKRWKSAKLQNTLIVKQGLDESEPNYQIRGYPGQLTQEELTACLQFRSELDKRKTDGESRYREIVNAYHGIEPEPYAICRFLRSRKFDVEAVFEMMGESLDVWKEASAHDFFPDADEAIGGAPFSVLLTQYPFLYSGIAKNGTGISYFKAGVMSVEGIDCVTDFENLTNMVWHNAMFGFPSQLKEVQVRDPDKFVLAESIAVFDLEGLAASNFNARTFEVLKAATKVNICFPEILNSLVVLNAPSYFSFFWSVIKGILDPRTAAKIEIFSNKAKGHKWLLNHIEEKELLSDYGGSGPSFDKVMQNQGKGKTFRRRLVELTSIPLKSKREIKFELAANESIDIQVYTRSSSGAHVSLFQALELVKTTEVKKTTPVKKGRPIVSTGAYSADIASGVNGPGKFRIVIKSHGGGDMKGPDHFLVMGFIN